MGVLKFTRTVILATIHLSFILFPLIFANNVYKSFDMEQTADQCAQEKLLEVNIYSLRGIIQSEYFDLANCYDMLFKVGCALILSAVISNRRILKMGTI